MTLYRKCRGYCEEYRRQNEAYGVIVLYTAPEKHLHRRVGDQDTEETVRIEDCFVL